jgi:hypothetical protein
VQKSSWSSARHVPSIGITVANVQPAEVDASEAEVHLVLKALNASASPVVATNDPQSLMNGIHLDAHAGEHSVGVPPAHSASLVLQQVRETSSMRALKVSRPHAAVALPEFGIAGGVGVVVHSLPVLDIGASHTYPISVSQAMSSHPPSTCQLIQAQRLVSPTGGVAIVPGWKAENDTAVPVSTQS